MVESKPLPGRGRQLPETRVLRSEIVEMKMRPGGREIETVETHAPGTLEFLPNRPVQRHRTLDGERHLDCLRRREPHRIASARRTSDPHRTRRRRSASATARGVLTRSKESAGASSIRKTGRMARLEQWGDFRYEEGDRKARAAKATLDQASRT